MLDLTTIRHPHPVVAQGYDENHRPRQGGAAAAHAAVVEAAGRSDRPRQHALVREEAARTRRADAACAHWAAGSGMIRHDDSTQLRVDALVSRLVEQGTVKDAGKIYGLLAAADRLCNAAMWLVVHQTYADRVHTDGRPLAPEEFKRRPEGHTGGSLNMVPAYCGYLLANALTGHTRSWIMGPGHCVSAIDSLNVLMGNLDPEQAARYGLGAGGTVANATAGSAAGAATTAAAAATGEGWDAPLTRFVQDFYSYRLSPEGRVAVPMGSHVNAYTAGGISEGGYLGFAELLYPHMPLPGERLVAFLSDGAFEEQRGSDWAPRWWRAEDSGMVTPILIANGRRIDQRSAIQQNGGVDWLAKHLQVNHFDPIVIDGRDPAAIAWSIIEMEERLRLWSVAVASGEASYPVPLPHAIAEAPKGFGFPGQATNDAHNLPLSGNPREDAAARQAFHAGAQALFVPRSELEAAIRTLSTHATQRRPQEKDHALAHRRIAVPTLPRAAAQAAPSGAGAAGAAPAVSAPMIALDVALAGIIAANPQLRPRIGNPDEMRSNRLNKTLDQLKHRVVHPEPGMAEAIDGAVITALNEEAVVCAALGNKGGINLVATYEAFGMKMVGAIRQELIFARHQAEIGRTPGWLSVPVVLTSHTWENGKNEQSHQDPGCAEALIGEMSDRSRVVFPVDSASAVAALHACYQSHGQIWTMVVPKNPLPELLSETQAEELLAKGALRLRGNGDEPLLLLAIGAYQCREALRASDRLTSCGVRHGVVAVAEPGRFRAGRDALEEAVLADAATRRLLAAPQGVRIALCHTRPELIAGLLRGGEESHTQTGGAGRLRTLGYMNHGGTLDVGGMLVANHCSWAHVLQVAAGELGIDPGQLLSTSERQALAGRSDPLILTQAPAAGAPAGAPAGAKSGAAS